MDLAAVLAATYPNAIWGESNNDYATLTWDESNADPKPTLAELEAAWPAVRDARAWDAIRVERDALLTASDWTVLPDAPLTTTQKTAWKTYRQTLRDLPQTFATPDGIVWPERP